MPRKPFKARPFQPSVGKPDVPVFSRGTILDNGLIGEKPLSKTAFETSRFIPPPKEAENDLYALNTLQLRRGWPLEQLSLQIPLEYLRDNLPPGVQNQVGIAVCGSPYVFNCDEDSVLRRARKMYRKWQAFWDIFHRSEYVFWPIEAERGYFVTAIFHMENGLVDDPDFDADGDPDAEIPQVQNPHFSVVGGWSVIDPQRGEAAQNRVARVIDRIQRIFEAEGITFDPESYQEHTTARGDQWALPWVPPPSEDDDWSSGIRSFALVRELVQRVLDLYCSDRTFEDNFFRVPTNGWLNVDQVRHEMMGICAVNAMEDMNWNARLAVECIQRITTVEGVPPFKASALAPVHAGKAVYIPESDINGVPETIP
ncbi:hypothetical protein GGS24DRAFT_512579 [Hypoxylon argillaceum]|nr:hypothetical protein GGS24DRAFT_512579 [Hypoxylon argillaceum]KAI1147424.1 hypothetical protein F4825DRAFT_471567 [Nemania diffusa]